ncbi:response regulator [Candidatus Poribacteria bacterium]|nr:response regulator [Candidatus Poribacteria bacterium]
MSDPQPILLLIEDDPAHALLIKRAFRKATYSDQIVHLSNGQEALDYLYGRGKYEGNPHSPTLIVLDINIPKINGLEVLKQLKSDSSKKTIPVVILSTSLHRVDILGAYANYANSYISKPVDFKAFEAKLVQLKQYWFSTNQLLESHE